MKEVYLTKEGLQELKDKLDYMVRVRRMECAEEVKKAREFGDLSENAEYDAAKQEQGLVEAEIKELEEKLLHVVIIEDDASTHTVSLGNTVKVKDVEFGDEDEYRIVGTTEADINAGKISNECPLGQALIGKKKGAVVKVVTPNGAIVEYKIIDIK
ncbi:MAG: transcription elongation factor GreA [Clostridia bacterium]|nr:transcription elongation factor GreA [Clostridia bacterium]